MWGGSVVPDWSGEFVFLPAMSCHGPYRRCSFAPPCSTRAWFSSQTVACIPSAGSARKGFISRVLGLRSGGLVNGGVAGTTKRRKATQELGTGHRGRLAISQRREISATISQYY